MNRDQLIEQIADARKNVRKLKRAAPYLFHEHARLQTAKRDLKAAQLELQAAQRAWDELGMDR